MREREAQDQLGDIANALIKHQYNILACKARIASNPTEADYRELKDHEERYEATLKSYRRLSVKNPITTSAEKMTPAQDPLISLLTDWLKKEGKLGEVDLQKLDDPVALAEFRARLSENMQSTAQPQNKLRLFSDGGLCLPVSYGMFCRGSQGSERNEPLRVYLTREEAQIIRENLPKIAGKIPERP